MAAESENESAGDSPARGGLNKALELTVNSARGEKSHSGEVDTDTDSEFCVVIPQTKESGLKADMLTLLAADLEQERPVGPTVNEKLAEISRSRFRQKMTESKLKNKMDIYPVPENCPDVSPPTLNSELTDKGYVDRTTKKSDGRLVNVQTMLSAATSCLLVETNSVHEYATDLAGQIRDGTAHAAGSGHAASASERTLTRANQTLASLGDAIAILGMAHQEISLRRNFLIQSALPKDIASICQNEDLPVKDKPFSGDVEKAIKSAREAQHERPTPPPLQKTTVRQAFFRSKRHSVQRVSQPEGAGCETSNIPERVWETPEAVVAASQEEAVSPENLMAEVSDFYDNIEALKTRLTDRSSKFAAGQIQHCLPQWQEITHDEEILKMVVGVDIQLLDEPHQVKSIKLISPVNSHRPLT